MDFLPRIRAVVEGEAPLPEKSEIAPMAEIWAENRNCESGIVSLNSYERWIDRLRMRRAHPLKLM